MVFQTSSEQEAIIKQWKTTENLCILIAIVYMLSVEQWDEVTVSSKLMSLTLGIVLNLILNMFNYRLEEQGMRERF
jgi:hypothetical protein